jgi:hypothetical protein
MLKYEGYLLITMGASEWEGIEKFHGVEMFWSHYDIDTNTKLIENAGFKIIYQKIDESGNEKHLIILAQK